MKKLFGRSSVLGAETRQASPKHLNEEDSAMQQVLRILSKDHGQIPQRLLLVKLPFGLVISGDNCVALRALTLWGPFA